MCKLVNCNMCLHVECLSGDDGCAFATFCGKSTERKIINQLADSPQYKISIKSCKTVLFPSRPTKMSSL